MWIYNASQQVNDASNFPTIIGISLTLCALMFIVVTTRLYVRHHMLNAIGIDDFVIVAAGICSIIYNSLTITQTRYGLGLPLTLRPKVNLNTYSTVNFVGRPFYMIGILGFKVALCFGYLRILPRAQKLYRYVVYVVLGIAIISHIGGTFVLIFNCHPVRKSWRPLTPGKCLEFARTNYILASTTVLMDIIILILPIPFLYALHMDNRKKFGIIGVFMLGIFTTICSIMRMTQIPVIATGSGNSTMLVLWGNVEMNVGIILSCLPILAPLFKFFTSKLTSRGYGSSTGKETHKLSSMNPARSAATANTKPNKTYSEMSSANESQEKILEITPRDGRLDEEHAGGIMKTIQITVKNSDSDLSRIGKGRNNGGTMYLE